MSTSCCPRCGGQVTLPVGLANDTLVRCPLCRARFSLADALVNMPPLLEVVEGDASSTEDDWLSESAPTGSSKPPVDFFADFNKSEKSAEAAAQSPEPEEEEIALERDEIIFASVDDASVDDAGAEDIESLNPGELSSLDLESEIAKDEVVADDDSISALDLPDFAEEPNLAEETGAAEEWNPEELSASEPLNLDDSLGGDEFVAEPAEADDLAFDLGAPRPPSLDAEVDSFGESFGFDELPAAGAALPNFESHVIEPGSSEGEEIVFEEPAFAAAATPEVTEEPTGNGKKGKQKPVKVKPVKVKKERPPKDPSAAGKRSLVSTLLAVLLPALVAVPLALYGAVWLSPAYDFFGLKQKLPAILLPNSASKQIARTPTVPQQLPPENPPEANATAPPAEEAPAADPAASASETPATAEEPATEAPPTPATEEPAVATDEPATAAPTPEDTAETTPASEEPTAAEETAEMPAEEPAIANPLATKPAAEATSADDPFAETPEEPAAEEEVPAEDMPAEEMPAEEMPAEVMPEEEAPAEDAATEEMSAEDAPAEEMPTEEETPVEEMPAEDFPAEEPATEDAAADAPAEDMPAEEMPAEFEETDATPAAPELPAAKEPAIEELPAQEPAAESTPTAPAAKDLGTLEVVGPRDVKQISSADVSGAMQATVDAFQKLAAAESAGDEAQLRKARAGFYPNLFALAEAVTLVKRDASDTALNGQLMTLQQIAGQQLAADPKQLENLKTFGARWFSFPKRTTNGIVLVGTVEGVEHTGGLFLTKLKLGTAADAKVVTLASATDPKLAAADRVLTLGTIIDKPAEALAGYEGTDPSVVWNGMTLKIAPE